MRLSSVTRRQYGTFTTDTRSRNASLVRLLRKLCHSASLLCARMMPWNGMAPMFSVPT